MNLILAADENWAIGYQGGLLAHLSGDMKYFRKTTLHKTIVMGRKTFESLPGGALKHRENIILSRKEYQAEGASVVHTLGELQDLLQGKAEEDIFVIGGGVSKAGDVLLPFIEKPFKDRAFFASQNVKFALATLGNDAGICGAAKMVLGD